MCERERSKEKESEKQREHYRVIHVHIPLILLSCPYKRPTASSLSLSVISSIDHEEPHPLLRSPPVLGPVVLGRRGGRDQAGQGLLQGVPLPRLLVPD